MAATIQLTSTATEADIIKALASLKDGGTVMLAKGDSIAISSGLVIDVANRDITLDLNGGTLQKAGNVTVITGVGKHDTAQTVKLGTDAQGNTAITYAKAPAGVVSGSWVKVISDDTLPGDHLDGDNPTRMGQAMEVLRVDGNTVTFKGALIDQWHYDTNVRATSYTSGALVIKNGDIAGDQTHTAWNTPLVQLRSVVDAQISDVTVRDGVGRGINVVDSVNAQITDVTVKNLLDSGSAALGIAVSSLSSSGTTVKGLYAENVTHASDNNAIGTTANSAYVVQYGGDIGMHVSDSVAYGTRNFAWSWHSEAVNGTFDNVMAFDSYGFLTARGIGGEMTNSGGAGNQRGVMFYEWGNGDAQDITLNAVTLKETLNYSTFVANNPMNNLISNSFFEAYGPGNLALEKNVKVTNTTFIKAAANADDVLVGTANHDMLLGGKGADKISVGTGDDYLWGGAGADTLTGGGGRDRFAYHALSEAGDTITDFQTGASGDLIDLSVMAAKSGWNSGDAIANGYVRFVQDGANVHVQVDANGGANGFTKLATLTNVKAAQLGAANLRLGLSDADAAPAPAEPVPAEPVPAGEAVLRGTDAANILRGGSATNQIIGAGGDDTLYASANSTALDGGTGNDSLTGNAGNDTLTGGTGTDWMGGGAGNDVYTVDAAGDTVSEGAGAGYDKILTGIQLSGSLAANVEALTLTGSAALSATGNALDNELTGNSGANRLSGEAGNDTIYGGYGNDIIYGGNGNDRLEGGAGTDKLYGDAGNDVLIGGEGADRLYGGDGNDILDGGQDADVLSGSLGADSVTYATASAAVTADLANSSANAGGAAGDSFSSIENLTGSAFNDELRGGQTANVLDGGAGNDRFFGGMGADILRGGSGTDWLDGGAQKDVLSGGTGADSFYFATIADGGDSITDFETGVDHLVLSRSGFGIGALKGFLFVEGLQATSASATLLFDDDSGQILWDADGTGAQKALVLATLSESTQLSNADIQIS